MDDVPDLSHIPVTDLSWADLRKQCKRSSVSAGGTRPELEERLKAARESLEPSIMEQAKQLMQQVPAAASSIPAAISQPVATVEQFFAQTAQTDAAASIADALKSPFPGDAQPARDETAASPGRGRGASRPRGRPRKPSIAPVPTSKQEPEEDLQAAPTAMPPAAKSHSSWNRNWLWLAVMVSALGAVTVVQQNPGLSGELQQRWQQLQTDVGSTSLPRIAKNWLKDQSALSSKSQCSRLIDPTGISMLIPTAGWMEASKAHFMDVLRGSPLSSTKASTILLVSSEVVTSHMAIQALISGLPPRCEASALHLLGEHWQQPGKAGQLQALLAGTLQANPYAVIIIEEVDQFSPDALVVLVNTAGEHGQLMHSGRSLPSHHALFLLTAQLPLMPSEMAGGEQFEHAAKEELRRKLAQRGSVRGAQDVSATINAFRRRIDLVLPLTEAVDQA
ncbi:hypothetical protein WJX74_004868 [Apatococcus lobatus]|uniref:SAP domain-containing protein n=1 Tax=Apatococcus lobatus TaxID=904363 RepID=A0AAW1QIK1_9CHLO